MIKPPECIIERAGALQMLCVLIQRFNCPKLSDPGIF